MPNLYANLEMVKSPGALNISGGSFDARLLALLEAASRWIDRHCNRHFYVVQEARVFDGAGPSLLVPDLIHVDTLRSADLGGGGFESRWEPAQYRLYPNNARPTQPWEAPTTASWLWGWAARLLSRRARARWRSRAAGGFGKCGSPPVAPWLPDLTWPLTARR